MNSVHPPAAAVREAVTRALAEDLLPLGDLSAVVLPERTVSGRFVARSEGMLAGTACATETYRQLDDKVTVEWHLVDGASLSRGATIGDVDGPVASVLAGERTALNFLSHLSGIATGVAAVVAEVVAVTGDGSVGIWDTRKTTPGLRSLEKAAVRAGGGRNHRGNLSEWVMLKDNHLATTSIGAAVATARDAWPGRTIHVECDTFEQALEAVAARADALLLDNMDPDEVTRTVGVVREAAGGRPCLIEASGGITASTAAAYAATGVDMISSGTLTNSAPVLDIGLDMGGN
jgi:nicotinate-nucleotide pyrophosphorylase (carboxylating)